MSKIKRKQSVRIDPDKICEQYKFYRSRYESSTHFCSNSSVSLGFGPVMGIDATNPDKPYWYLFGFFLFSYDSGHPPHMYTKISPYMKWIQENMNDYNGPNEVGAVIRK